MRHGRWDMSAVSEFGTCELLLGEVNVLQVDGKDVLDLAASSHVIIISLVCISEVLRWPSAGQEAWF